VALCARSGLIGPELPHRVAQELMAFERFGMLGGAMVTAAIRHGGRTGLIDGASLSEDEVKQYVRDNLARYKSPREVVFLDSLPRNPTGKILKSELAEYQVP
jgi:acyl-CoA synthetase (AMP-forming)/AMP-acid ligase II